MTPFSETTIRLDSQFPDDCTQARRISLPAGPESGMENSLAICGSPIVRVVGRRVVHEGIRCPPDSSEALCSDVLVHQDGIAIGFQGKEAGRARRALIRLTF